MLVSLFYAGTVVCQRDVRWSLLMLLIFFNGVALGSPGNWDNKGLSTLTVIGTSYSPVTSVEWTSDKTSDISALDRKIIAMAHEDALSYVASDGEIHGALLEQAFKVLRAHGVRGEDIDVAKMIAAEVQAKNI